MPNEHYNDGFDKGEHDSHNEVEHKPDHGGKGNDYKQGYDDGFYGDNVGDKKDVKANKVMPDICDEIVCDPVQPNSLK